jgi:uncharacterized LabA/DUF88 family protein
MEGSGSKRAWLGIDGGHFMKATEKYGKLPMQQFIDALEDAYHVTFTRRMFFQGTPDGKRSGFHSAISYPRNGGFELIIRPLKEQNVTVYDENGCSRKMKVKMETGVDADITCELTKALMDSRYDVVIMIAGDGDISRPFEFAPVGVHAHVCGLEGSINEKLNPFVKPVIGSNGKTEDYLYINYIFEKLNCEERTDSGEDYDGYNDCQVLANFKTRR